MKDNNNQILALAGVFQAALLVSELAESGKNDDQDAFNTSIDSLYKINSQNSLAVYGGFNNLKIGLNQLTIFFAKTKAKTNKLNHIMRYALNILLLAKKLKKNPAFSKIIQEHIQRAEIQCQHFSPLHDNIIANFADAYVKTFGQLPRRVQVIGNAKFLENKQTINKIRSLLLAGVRSAVLWQQNGGRIRHLLFFKNRISQSAKKLINE